MATKSTTPAPAAQAPAGPPAAPPPPPPPPPRGASTQAPEAGRPKLPNRLTFYGKNIQARALGDSVTFGVSAAGNVQLACPFAVEPGQRAVAYSVTDEMAKAGIKPGDFVEIPPGTYVTMVKALTPDAAPYAVDRLRTAGWRGSSFVALQKGQADGLGGTPDAPHLVRLTVEVKDKNGSTGAWLVSEDGTLNPWMEVAFVNRLAGFNFKTEAEEADLKRLDREMAALLRDGAAPTQKPAQPAPTQKPAPATGGAPAGAPSPADVPPADDADGEVDGTQDDGEDDIPF